MWMVSWFEHFLWKSGQLKFYAAEQTAQCKLHTQRVVSSLVLGSQSLAINPKSTWTCSAHVAHKNDVMPSGEYESPIGQLAAAWQWVIDKTWVVTMVKNRCNKLKLAVEYVAVVVKCDSSTKRKRCESFSLFAVINGCYIIILMTRTSRHRPCQ